MRLLKWVNGFHRGSVKIPRKVQDVNETSQKEMGRETESWVGGSGNEHLAVVGGDTARSCICHMSAE